MWPSHILYSDLSKMFSNSQNQLLPYNSYIRHGHTFYHCIYIHFYLLFTICHHLPPFATVHGNSAFYFNFYMVYTTLRTIILPAFSILSYLIFSFCQTNKNRQIQIYIHTHCVCVTSYSSILKPLRPYNN